MSITFIPDKPGRYTLRNAKIYFFFFFFFTSSIYFYQSETYAVTKHLSEAPIINTWGSEVKNST